MVDVIREAKREARKALRGEGLDNGESVLQIPGYSLITTQGRCLPPTSGNPIATARITLFKF
jgi:hypothetical protein